MKGLRVRFERWCLKNRNIGIPNLMLYISIATAIVFLMCTFGQSTALYKILCFDRDLILQGQVWRLITYIFTYGAYGGYPFLIIISLICYYSLGRTIERIWGTFRFNLFYFTGVLFIDAYAMIFDAPASVLYLNMSLFLAFATLYPDAGFLMLFVVPVKGWLIAFIDLAWMLYTATLTIISGDLIGGLFPLVAISNYFLFFGRDVVNILPPPWRRGLQRKKKVITVEKVEPIPFQRSTPPKENHHVTIRKASYTHCCTVCGRTDVSNPELEFRYCSRCNGYHCYCEEHINNHDHID